MIRCVTALRYVRVGLKCDKSPFTRQERISGVKQVAGLSWGCIMAMQAYVMTTKVFCLLFNRHGKPLAQLSGKSYIWLPVPFSRLLWMLWCFALVFFLFLLLLCLLSLFCLHFHVLVFTLLSFLQCWYCFVVFSFHSFYYLCFRLHLFLYHLFSLLFLPLCFFISCSCSFLLLFPFSLGRRKDRSSVHQGPFKKHYSNQWIITHCKFDSQ